MIKLNTWSVVHKFKAPRAFIEVVEVKLRIVNWVALKPCIIEFKAVICWVVNLDADP